MKLTTSTLAALLLLAAPSFAQDGDNMPPAAPPAEGEAAPAKPAGEEGTEKKEETKEEPKNELRVHPKALEILKKAEGLRYSPLKGGLKTMKGKLNIESPMGNISLDMDYDASREGKAIDKVGMKLLTQVPFPEEQLIAQLKPQIQGMFFGSSMLEILENAHLDYVEDGEGKGNIVMELAKGPTAGMKITNTMNAESGTVASAKSEMPGGGGMTQDYTYAKNGDTYRLVSSKITQSNPMGMSQEIEVSLDYMECGDVALPWKVTVSQMMGSQTIQLEGVIVNGKPYATPAEAAAKKAEEKPEAKPEEASPKDAE